MHATGDQSDEQENATGHPPVSRAPHVLKESAIINTASVTGLAGIQNITPYPVAKHAVVCMTKSAAMDHGYQQIRVNGVCPSMADTPLS